MSKEITDEQLIAFIEGEDAKELREAIENDLELKGRYLELKEVIEAISSSGNADVPEHIGSNIQEAIHSEQVKSNRTSKWMQIAAAAALLIIGFGIGRIPSGNASSSELLALHNEIQSLKEVTLSSTLQQYSASERIMAVNQIESVQSINPDLLKTLINTFNSDESPSVRYAALQALSKYADNGNVRAELVKALDAQTDPLIQISLISILVEVDERSAIAPLKDIIKNENATPEVKQQAELAIEVLS